MAEDVAALHGRLVSVEQMKAEPQMAQAVILMIASRGCWIFGSGTVSIRTSPFPRQRNARMIAFSKCRRQLARSQSVPS